MTGHNRSEKARAVFLAALMVVSVFGASIAFAGSAAAAAGSVSADTSYIAIGDSASFTVSDSDNPSSATVAFTSTSEPTVTGTSETFSGDGSKTTFRVSNVPLADTDGSGTIAGDEVTATVGGTGATVSSVDPVTGDVTLQSAPAAGTDNVQITYDYYPESTTVDVSSGSATASIPTAGSDSDGTLNVADGDTVTAHYWDGSSGELTYRTATLTVDGAAPSAPQGVSATAVSGGDIEVSFDDVDEASGSGVTTYSVKRATSSGGSYSEVGTVNDDDSTSYTYTDTSASDGTTYYYVVTAIDAVNNEGPGSSEVSATSDATAPTVNSFQITNNDPTNTQDIDVSLTTDEQLADIGVSVSGAESGSLAFGDFSETDNSDGTFTYTATYAGSTDGDYTVTLDTAADAAGNDGSNSESDTVTVDTQPPQDPNSITVQTTTPINSDTETSVDIDVNFNSQPESGTVSLKVSDGTNSETFTTAASTGGTATSFTGLDLSTLTDGTLTATAKITDDAGNENPSGYTASNQFQKDTDSLSVSISNPTDGDVVQSQDTIAGSSSDDNGVSSVALTIQRASNGDYWDGGSWVGSSTTVAASAVDGAFDSADEDWTYDSSSITGDDSYTVTAEVTDTAGNTNTDTVSYEIDTTPPSIDSASVTSTDGNEDGVYVSGETVAVTVTYGEKVIVDTSSGTPTLDLGTNVAGDATYVSGSGSTSIVFEYTVQDGDDGSLTIGDITLNGGTMQDEAGNSADLTASGQSITASVDAVDPQDPNSITVQTATPINSNIDTTVDVDVGFSSAPETGTVTLKLSDGTNQVTAEKSASQTTSFTGVEISSLNDGRITATAKMTDAAGNENPAGFTADTEFGKRTISISAQPDGADQTATHKATWSLASETDVSVFEVDYSVNGFTEDITGVTIESFGLDTNGDGTIDTSLTADKVSYADGSVLTVENTSGVTIGAGEQVILTYSGVTNPSADTDVGLNLDPSTGDVAVTRTLTIGSTSAPTVTDVSISGTSVSDGSVHSEAVNGTSLDFKLQFSKSLDTNTEPSVSFTVGGETVEITNTNFEKTGGNENDTYNGSVDINVDNAEVDATVEVSGAVGADGNVQEGTNSRTFEIDTAPLGIVAAITGEDNDANDNDVVFVTLNDSYANVAGGDDFTVTDDDENEITYTVDGSYSEPKQIKLNLDTSQPANETPTVTLNDNGITDDADNGVSSTTQQVEATDGVAPDIDDFTHSVSNDQVTLTVVADEPLNTSAISVELTNGETTTVTAFQATDSQNTYEATTTVADADWTATLTQAEDEAGNDGANDEVTSPSVDTSGPSFELVTPSNNPTSDSSNIAIEIDDQTGVNTSSTYITVEDADGVVLDHARTAPTGSNIDISNDVDASGDGDKGDLSITGLNLADGQVNITVESDDTNGYSNSAKFTYEVDTQIDSGEVVAPAETVYKPTDGTLQVKYNYVDSNVDVVEVKLVDTNTGQNTVTYNINDADYVDDGTNKTVTLDLANADTNAIVGDTDYGVDVKVSDSLGNTETYSTNGEYVVIDDTAPTTSSFGADDNTDPQTDFSFDILDDDSTDSGVDASTIELEVNQSSSTLFEGTVADSAVTFDSNTLTFDTAKARIQYSDNEPVTVNVTVSDNVGNTLNTSADDNPVGSFTVNDVDPVIDSVEAEAGTDTVVVNFNEGVYTNADGTGAVDATDFAYQSGNGGATAIDSVDHNEGDSAATLHLDATVTASDIGSDLVSVNENAVFDLNGVAVDHSVTHALTDSTLPGKPVLTTDGNVTAQNEGSYGVTVTGDTVSTANIAVKNSSGNVFAEKTNVDVSSGSARVTFDLTNLEEGDVTIDAEVIDRGVDRRSSTSTMVTKDNTSATMTVKTNAGTKTLEVTFDETVKNADSESAFDLENMSFSQMADDSVVNNSDYTRFTLYLDEPVAPSDIQNEDVTVSATSQVTDVVGTEADQSENLLEDGDEPGIAYAGASNDSKTVYVFFDEMVYNSSGGNLSADNFTYVNNSGVDHTIESVDHMAGETEAVLTLDSVMTPADLNEDEIKASFNDSVDKGTTDVALIHDSVDIDHFEIANVSDKKVQVTFEANEELATFDVNVWAAGDLPESSADDDTVALDESDFEVEQSGHTFTYTANVTVPRDGLYIAELEKGAKTVGGSESYEHPYDTTVVDTKAPAPFDAEIVDAWDGQTLVAVQFDEPINVVSNDWKLALDGVNQSAGIWSVDPGAGEIEFVIDDNVDTGDMPAISFSGDGLIEEHGVGADTPVDETASTTLDTHEYHLKKGVNFVSIPAEYGTLDIANSDFSGMTIMTYDEGNWHTYNPDKPADEQDFEKMEGGQGYIVTADADETVHVNVRNEEPGDTAESATPGQQHLEEGWNLVGHWQEGHQKKSVAFGTISESDSTHVWGQKTDGEFSYATVEQLSSDWRVDLLVPGEAYWVFVEDDEVYTAAEYVYSGDA